MTGHIYIADFQSIENFGGCSPPGSIWHIVVADQEKNRDTCGGQSVDASGELALLGLCRFTSLVSVPAEEYQVYIILQGVVNELVKGVQEVIQARGQTRRRVDAPVILNTQV